MRLVVHPCRAHGGVAAPPSKSMAHRLLISAGLAGKGSVVHGISSSEDILATLDCLRSLGIEWTRTGDSITVVRSVDLRRVAPAEALFCRESGSTLRFFLPLALLSENPVTLRGSAYLLRRPMGVYEELCRMNGLSYRHESDGITVCGPLQAGEFTVVGNISSQFISGLLFALPLAEGDSMIRILPPVESRSYLDLTVASLREFGIDVSWRDEYTLVIPGNQQYRACEATVEGDYSNAAFLDAFGMLGDGVRIDGLPEKSLQGDRVYKEYFNLLKQGRTELSIGDCPDLGPILFAFAAANHGGTFHGTARLRIKESDRAEAMARELAKFGTRVQVNKDSVIVDPVAFHRPSERLYGHNDHRIVMALAVLLTLVGGELDGAEAMEKSFPDFTDRMRKIGLEAEIQDEA